MGFGALFLTVLTGILTVQGGELFPDGLFTTFSAGRPLGMPSARRQRAYPVWRLGPCRLTSRRGPSIQVSRGQQMSGEDFREVAHCGGKISFHVKTNWRGETRLHGAGPGQQSECNGDVRYLRTTRGNTLRRPTSWRYRRPVAAASAR